jgi:uncharacterized protein (TIGR02594 family)
MISRIISIFKKQPPEMIKVDLQKELILEASKWIGIHEIGDNKGKEVEMFQKAVDGKASGEPWCAAFVQYCVKQVCSKYKNVPAIPSSESCMFIWNNTSSSQRISSPEPGCIIIWNHEGTAKGHVGIVSSVFKPHGAESAKMETIEGNTGPESSVNREGDGVYKKTRYTKTFSKMKIMGYLKPFKVQIIEVEKPK